MQTSFGNGNGSGNGNGWLGLGHPLITSDSTRQGANCPLIAHHTPRSQRVAAKTSPSA